MSYSFTALQVERMLGDWRVEGPAYSRLAEAFEVMIADGRLPAGARLPAERTFATHCGLSRNTVTAAYRVLREQGYLTSGRGAGSFVLLPATEQKHRIPSSWAADQERQDIDLAIASLPAPESILGAATRRAALDLGQYSHLPGYDLVGAPELRQAIADRYTARGLPTGPEQIMVSAGADHALGLVIRLLSRPGDSVLVDSPTYPNALDTIRALRRRPLTVGLGMDGWDTDVLEAVLRQEKPALAYLMPDYHNPTGLVMPDGVRAAVAAAARASSTILVVDEATCELGLDGGSLPLPLASWAAPRQVVSIGSMSKTCWAGLRLGWVRAATPVISRLVDLRCVVDTGNPVMTQLIGLRVLESYDELLAERREMLLRRRQVLAESLARRIPQWRYTMPDGGFSLWVDLGARLSSPLALAAARRGVKILSGGRFGVDGTLENHIRIPFATDEESIATACDRLAGAWREVTSHRRGHA
ncbi:MocR-like transcription factor YczR [Kitasatospora mediocidica]|uniref:MocR-like transcription factor YczR n=1 Tax=Kitasatospora mediocidica TaxID=58352 RepID=UPI00055BC6E2|nr:PLP-dependent aminotransferase family protein [Kitasatospora mediocidica]